MSTIAQLIDVKGRTAIVTGAAGKLGTAISETLAELGATVVAIDRDEASLAGLCSHLPSAIAVPWDLGDSSTFPALRARILELAAPPDILVNNAAYLGHSELGGWTCEFENQSPEPWNACLNLNLATPFRLVQAFAPDLAATGHGTVINIASIHATLGPDWSLYEGTEMGHPAAYAASKGGLLQITRWLATTLAPKIRVNAISPGGVTRDQPEAFVDRYQRRTPLGRMATPEDIKGAIAYLASDLSAYVTGQEILVDGGYSAW